MNTNDNIRHAEAAANLEAAIKVLQAERYKLAQERTEKATHDLERLTAMVREGLTLNLMASGMRESAANDAISNRIRQARG